MSKVARQFADEARDQNLRIGEVAAASGVGVEALRFYERRGLLGRPARTLAGYRAYTAEVLERLAFIKRAQAIGFSLDEIGEILSMRESGQTPCLEVRAAARRKLAELDERLRQMRRYRTELARLLNDWDERGIEEGKFCGLIEGSDLKSSIDGSEFGRRTRRGKKK